MLMIDVMTTSQLMDVCASSTVAEAAAHGERFGWKRQDDARLAEWRSGFLRHNGGAVEVIGWQPGPEEQNGLLSFWVANGPNAHRACYFSVTGVDGLLRDLSTTLGRPASLDEMGDIVSAAWTLGPTEVQYVRTGDSAVVNVVRYTR